MRTSALLEDFAAALALYRERRFGEALDAFRAIVERHPEDGPATVYLERCREHLIHPRPWSGTSSRRSRDVATNPVSYDRGRTRRDTCYLECVDSSFAPARARPRTCGGPRRSRHHACALTGIRST
jgi:hypothetical protein